MKTNKIFSKKKIIFLLLFSGLALIGMNINFSALVGAENQYFTLFQFFGPIAGSFLGPVVGVIAVFIAEIVDLIVSDKALTLLNIGRLFTMLFATYFFATDAKKMLKIITPLAAIFLFVLHPVGREVWFFTLYWTIPIIATLLPKKYSNSLVARSLGATFTAHAVGGALWIWTVPMTAAQWIGLIPIVAYERLLFAAGIVISYIVVNAFLDKTLDKLKIKVPSNILHINKKFTLSAAKTSA